MKIEIKKKGFEIAIGNVSKALNANSPLHSLQGVYLKVTGNSLILIASNGNLSIKEEVSEVSWLNIIQPGEVLLPGKLFTEVIKKHSDEITISETKDFVEVTSNDMSTKINILNPTDYPTISFEATGKDVIIDSSKLRSIIKNVSFAASDQDKRIILNGVNLSAKGGKLTAAATNSYRLAREESEINNEAEFEVTILSKNLRDFIPASAKGEIKISVNDSKIITKYETTTVVSNLIDGVYPQIERLIPTEAKATLKIDAKEIAKLIDKATVVSNEANKVVKMTIDTNLIVESKRDEVGNTKVESHNFKWEGGQFSIAFNAQFFKEAVSKFSGEIEIKFLGPLKPFVIVGDSNKNLLQLVLPHRSY